MRYKNIALYECIKCHKNVPNDCITHNQICAECVYKVNGSTLAQMMMSRLRHYREMFRLENL